MQVIEEFAEERSWLKIQGDEKKELLEASLRPNDRVVEFGCRGLRKLLVWLIFC